MSTKDQIEALDKEFVETMESLQTAVAIRHWIAFRDIAEHAGRVAGCLQILDQQQAREHHEEAMPV